MDAVTAAEIAATVLAVIGLLVLAGVLVASEVAINRWLAENRHDDDTPTAYRHDDDE